MNEDKQARAALNMLAGVQNCTDRCGRVVDIAIAASVSGRCFWCWLKTIDRFHKVNKENFDGWPTVGFAPSDNTQGNQ